MTKIITFDDIDIEFKKLYEELSKQESYTTGVVYEVFNIFTLKSYIGKAHSYVKNGNQPVRRQGAKGRFYKHWKSCHNGENDCPIFYEALRNSDPQEWAVIILKVCSLKHLKEWETKMIERLDTSNPDKGYNYFVGDNKPNNPEYLVKYQSAKATSNAERAVSGALKKKAHNKDLPANINYRKKINKNGSIGEGYFVQIKIDGHLYNKAFLSGTMSMEAKLEAAKKTLEKFKQEAASKRAKRTKPSGSKTTRSTGRK
ncbi:putative intron encoded endonuclease [Acanthamoeba polyphaga mimivirus]|uniref:Putative intron encoded endonuclease n=1 Tax=Acanthamoeba polyphaga mimivirus TaxID=212035 RepID=A0A0G2Y408_MIMIV|nr:putative intron encoded endonuclease [Acanthamoeba polyphaga mimivirus]